MTTPLDRWTNSALTTLAVGLDNITNPATMVVASAVGFPVAGSYRVLVGTELLQVTAGAGTTNWTVNRQVEGTLIAAHNIGDAVVHVMTAFEANSFVQTFNPIAYGAKGDNVTDDVAAFQAAINDAHAAPFGGWVFLPTLAYKVGSGLTTYSNVAFFTYGATLSGAGASSVVPLINVSLVGGLSLPGALAVLSGGASITGALAQLGVANVTSPAATAFTVASSGINYGLQVDESNALAVTGLLIKAAAAGAGLALSVINGNAAEAIKIDAKGAGTIGIGTVSSGAITLGQATTITSGGLTVSSGGLTVTGNSTVTGALGGISTLTATTLAGTLSTAAQPNVTSTGILASLHMTSPVIDSGGLGITAGNLTLTAGTYSQSDAVTSTGTSHLNTATTITSGSILQLTQNTSAMSGTGLLMNLATSGSFTGKFLDLQVNGASKFSIDSFGHLISGASGTPTTSTLGANVTSATFTGNDTRGTIAIVMAGALAANTKVCTATFANSYGATAPKVTLVDQTSTAGLAIVNSYVQAQSTGVSFDIAFNQALAAGTYTIDYIVIG